MLRAERLDDRLPAADAIRGGMPVWLESRQDRDSRYPELAEREPNVVSSSPGRSLVLTRKTDARPRT